MQRARGQPEDGSRGRTATVVAVGGTALVVVALGSMLLRGRPLEVVFARWMIHNSPMAIVPLMIGWAIQRRWPDHGLARVFLTFGAASALHVGFIAYVDLRLVALGYGPGPDVAFVPRDLPLDVAVSFWLTSWLWILAAGLGVGLVLLLFPDGRLPSPRWWPVVVLAATATSLLVVGYMTWAWPWTSRVVVMTEQPSDLGMTPAVLTTGWVLLLLALAGAIASLVGRWRTSTSEERTQLRPVILSGTVLGLAIVVLFPLQRVWIPAVLVALVVFLTSYVWAVLRFRLHDLDVVVNRAVVASVLAALVFGLYLAVVVGVGSLVGRQIDTPFLSLVAVGLAAVLFEPARRWVRRVVDRLLYGRDADAYEVLSELAGQLRAAGSVEEVAERVASLLHRGSGASAVQIRLIGDGQSTELATAGAPVAPIVLREPVRQGGQWIGEVVVHARVASDLAPDAPGLVADVAGMLGAVLRNALLTVELRQQVEALRRSRQRLVTAQDAARRDLERDLHDGAQARLVALRLQVGLVAAELARLDEADLGLRLQKRIQGLGTQVDEAIRELRVLAHGLRPPVLESDGLVAALRAAIRGFPATVTLDGDGIGRFAPSVEAAVYFTCLESIRNATAHASADHVEVGLACEPGCLRFWIEDDGVGFDPQQVVHGHGLDSLDDRIGGLGGTLAVSSAPGRGTRVEGVVPAQPADSAR